MRVSRCEPRGGVAEKQICELWRGVENERPSLPKEREKYEAFTRSAKRKVRKGVRKREVRGGKGDCMGKVKLWGW